MANNSSKRWSSLRIGLRWKSLRALKRVNDFWNHSSGDWHWLTEKPTPVAAINRELWRAAVPSVSFCVLSMLSCAISTFGLLAGSTATVIGAMIVAPLMGPVIAMAYAIAVANRRLFRRSALTVACGIAMTVLISWAIAKVIGLQVLNPEILSRTRPTLIDLGVAIAAGAAGAFANSRRRIADALPGVAIAVALVPPLSVVGIGFAQGNEQVGVGALILFITNLIGIVFSGSLVFLLQRYGSVERAKQGLFAGVVMLTLLMLPLSISLRNLLIEQTVRNQIQTSIRSQISAPDEVDIQSVQMRFTRKTLFINLRLTAPEGFVTQEEVESLRDLLSDQIDRSVDLRVQVTPIEAFNLFD
ncbi:MAG: TIGR00341 family protein [Elainellaceae cyanobacterium]